MRSHGRFLRRGHASVYGIWSNRVAPRARPDDGTLWSEQPVYFQLAFAFDRVRQLAPRHREWKAKEPFQSLLAGDMKGVMATGEKGLLEIVAASHAGYRPAHAALQL